MSAPVSLIPCPVTPCRGLVGSNGIVCADCERRTPKHLFQQAELYRDNEFQGRAFRNAIIDEAAKLLYAILGNPFHPEHAASTLALKGSNRRSVVEVA